MKLLLILLLVFGCDSPIQSDASSNELDVNWILIKSEHNVESGEYEYIFVYIPSESFSLESTPVYINEAPEDMNNLSLSFIYNNESFIFDLSDIYIDFPSEVSFQYESLDVTRIMYNEEMDYITIFYVDGEDILDAESGMIDIRDYQIVDYR